MRTDHPLIEPQTAGPQATPRLGFSAGKARSWALAAIALALTASCSLFVGPSAGLNEVSHPEDRAWTDDATPESLDLAIERSQSYYRRLPEDHVFRYGEWRYAPSEMIASLELFRALARDPEGLPSALERDFHVFESVSHREENLITGYYEPTIAGAMDSTGEMTAPIYSRPRDMVEVRLDRFGSRLPSRKLVGRVDAGELLPYYSRAEIRADGLFDGTAAILAYVNEVDLFFLQIQGSGVVRFPDGREMKVSYDGSNGHPYRSLGAELVQREALPREEVTLQSIRRYLRENPEEVRSLLDSNPSYVFFREVEEGPVGNIEVPLTPGRSLAVDHRLFAKGGLAYLEVDLPTAESGGQQRMLRRFFLIQDTGGAIRGHGRADIFWGGGAEAEWIAGQLKHPGRLFILVARKEALAAFTARNP